MNLPIIALAGLAEIALQQAMAVMGGLILVIGVVSCLAMVFKSRVAAVVSTVFLMLFTVVFRPWYALAPLSSADYQDPDMVAVAQLARLLGAGWIVICVLVVLALRKTWPPARFY